MSFSLKACVWDCFRMRGYDAQIFLGFLHLGFGRPGTHLSMCKYSRLQLSSLAACLFGTATQHCFQTHTSMPMCMCGNTASHPVCRTNEPRWLGLTVLWVFAYTRAVRYWQKDIPIIWDLVDNDYLMIIMCLIQYANLAGLGLLWTTDYIFHIFDRNLHN